jgi:hypothetical protein
MLADIITADGRKLMESALKSTRETKANSCGQFNNAQMTPAGTYGGTHY